MLSLNSCLDSLKAEVSVTITLNGMSASTLRSSSAGEELLVYISDSQAYKFCQCTEHIFRT